MIIITGATGFIASNLVNFLNKKKIYKLILVDEKKYLKINRNIKKTKFIKKLNKDQIFNFIKKNDKKIKCIFHLGANSSTAEKNFKKIIANNFTYSKKIIDLCINKNIKIIYASSASIYGDKKKNIELEKFEKPKNYYAISKYFLDRYARKVIKKNQDTKIIGLRYFNVFGPFESHKKEMTSMVYKFFHQIKKDKIIRVFEGSHGYRKGEHLRDFIYIDDAIKFTYWALKNKSLKSGIYNVGSGQSNSINQLANYVKQWFKKYKNIDSKIEYIKFPKKFYKGYQAYTKASLAKVRKSGYKFKTSKLENTTNKYLNYLDEKF